LASCDGRELAAALRGLMLGGGIAEFERVCALLRPGGAPLQDRLIDTRLAWDAICAMYEDIMPQASFMHFYWAWRALCGGLFATLSAPLPRARVYHTVTTGYAGLIAARAQRETGRPMIVTEHGIYTNERRIEILMAEWVADMIDKGISLDDPRLDLRDIWMQAFDAYARCCYQAASSITTLYENNQRLQLAIGADPSKLRVIANGVDVARFETLPQAGADLPPTVALIGRVVAIKDVKTYLSAIAIVRRRIPNVRALVLGPKEEDASYANECQQLATELELDGIIEFPGSVALTAWLPKIHVVALTSLSEAQPLVLLEAGAARVPCVATDVGCCRELLEGRADEEPRLGPGGIVTGLFSPEETAEAICRLLENPELRSSMGRVQHARVARYYSTARATALYAELYASAGAGAATAAAEAA
jgi:glycosyltransferase involved in cell wall biosynthesis